MTTPRPQHVVLVGLMGSGKTAIGGALARALGRSYLDNDAELERRTGRRAHDLAADAGLDALHREEAAMFAAALARKEPEVISAPASVITDPEIRAALKDHLVVWLDTDLDVLAARVRQRTHRPMIEGDPRAFIEHQYRERAPLYREIASLVLPLHGDEPADDVVRVIREALKSAETGRDGSGTSLH